MWIVLLNKSSQKAFNKAPKEIQEEFIAWSNLISATGPNSLQSINEYWDHALKGDWAGARSSSLSRKWRVIYSIKEKEVTVLVLQISAHKY